MDEKGKIERRVMMVEVTELDVVGPEVLAERSRIEVGSFRALLGSWKWISNEIQGESR